MLTIRAYEAADWTALCHIHDRARLDELCLTVGVDGFRTLQQAAEEEGLFAGELWVACENDCVVGFIAFKPDEITWLYVETRRYREGVGRRLLRFALTRCDDVVRTQCLQGNTPAYELYRSEGFRLERIVAGGLAGAENVPAVAMTLVLRQ